MTTRWLTNYERVYSLTCASVLSGRSFMFIFLLIDSFIDFFAAAPIAFGTGLFGLMLLLG